VSDNPSPAVRVALKSKPAERAAVNTANHAPVGWPPIRAARPDIRVITASAPAQSKVTT